MSRIGKRPIKLIEGVEVSINGSDIFLKSAKGEVKYNLSDGISAKIEGENLLIDRDSDTKTNRAMHGLYARLIKNSMLDLKDGFKKILDFKGTGYRVRVEGDKIILNRGYSHEISLDIPEGVSTSVIKNSIIIEGIKREAVGQFAAMVRDVRGPEPYKGKGIKYREETIKRKAGKAAQSGAKA